MSLKQEYLTIWQCGAAGIGLVLSSVLYAVGGREWKAWRRFFGSFVLAFTLCGTAYWRGLFSWPLIATWPLISIGFHFGYGGDVFFSKVINRSVYVFVNLSAGIFLCFLLGGWKVFPVHLGVAIWTVYLGVINPLESPAEEFFISILLNVGVIMYLFL